MSDDNSFQQATANRNMVVGSMAALAILGLSTITYTIVQSKA